MSRNGDAKDADHDRRDVSRYTRARRPRPAGPDDRRTRDERHLIISSVWPLRPERVDEAAVGKRGGVTRSDSAGDDTPPVASTEGRDRRRPRRRSTRTTATHERFRFAAAKRRPPAAPSSRTSSGASPVADRRRRRVEQAPLRTRDSAVTRTSSGANSRGARPVVIGRCEPTCPPSRRSRAALRSVQRYATPSPARADQQTPFARPVGDRCCDGVAA